MTVNIVLVLNWSISSLRGHIFYAIISSASFLSLTCTCGNPQYPEDTALLLTLYMTILLFWHKTQRMTYFCTSNTIQYCTQPFFLEYLTMTLLKSVSACSFSKSVKHLYWIKLFKDDLRAKRRKKGIILTKQWSLFYHKFFGSFYFSLHFRKMGERGRGTF